jgi:hypothetical protein
MVLIDVYGSGTVALGVFMLFYFAVILFLPYFHFQSNNIAQFVGKFGKNKRSATSVIALKAPYRIVIGTTVLPTLKGKAGRLCRANRRSAGIFSANLKFSLIFFFHCASPIGRVNCGTNSIGAA